MSSRRDNPLSRLSVQPVPTIGTRKPTRRPERLVQRACVQVLVRCVPPPPEGPAWTAINPAPGKMSKALAGINKSMGMRAGWMDLLMIFKGKAILVEFKAEGGRLSKEQIARRDEVIAAGGFVEECRSMDEFVAILDKYGIPCRILRR